MKINGKPITSYAVDVTYVTSSSDFKLIWMFKHAKNCAMMVTRLCAGKKVGGIRATENLCKLLWKLGLKLQ